MNYYCNTTPNVNYKLTNAVVFEGEKEINSTLYIEEGFFTKNEIPGEAIDCKNDWVIPGFIDLQVYGGDRLFSDDPTVDTLHKIVSICQSGGATSIMPTIATHSVQTIFRCIEAVKQYQQQKRTGILGLHLEGPFINPIKKGAHLENFIIKPDVELVKRLVDKAEGVIKMMTVAPECCDDDVQDYCIQNGIALSAGHSAATYEEGKKFLQKNKLVTHLFNAMSSLHHRNPGLPGAVIGSNHAYASIVADGYHVNFDMVAIAKKLLGERLFLITDAVAQSTGVYPHQLHEDHYILPDGTLSGSALTMIQAVKNCVEKAGIPVGEAFRMASLYPAKALGLKSFGNLDHGSIADCLIINKRFEIKTIIKNGIVVKDLTLGSHVNSL